MHFHQSGTGGESVSVPVWLKNQIAEKDAPQIGEQKASKVFIRLLRQYSVSGVENDMCFVCVPIVGERCAVRTRINLRRGAETRPKEQSQFQSTKTFKNDDCQCDIAGIQRHWGYGVPDLSTLFLTTRLLLSV